MSEPLYLKYRPQKLSELVGQEIISKTLTNAIKVEKTAHAYFFTGPRGCGKTSTARIIAKSLNCKNGPITEPCGVCQNCVEIAQGISPDVIEIDAASHRSVEDATLVIERCHLAPQTAKYKIYILDEVHMLSKEAFNALLKTIEEPPPNVVFILATTEEHKVPQTIVSRCQRFSFRPIDVTPLTERLRFIAEQEQIKLTENSFLRIAKQSKGGLRDALSLLDQISILAPNGELIDEDSILKLFGGVSEELLSDLLNSLLLKDVTKVLEQTINLLEQGIDPIQIARNLVEFSIDQLEKDVLENKDSKDLIRIINQLAKAEYSLRNSSQASTKLKSELLAISLNSQESQSQENNINLLKRIEQLEQKILFLDANSQNVQKNEPNLSHNQNANAKRQGNLEVNNNINLGDTSLKNEILQDNDNQKKRNENDIKSLNDKSILDKPKDKEQNTSSLTADGGNGSIINILMTKLKHIPTKAAIQGGKVFVANESSTEDSYNIVFGIPLKTFYDKLNDAKKIKIIEDTLSEELNRSVKAFFEINSSVPKSIDRIEKQTHKQQSGHESSETIDVRKRYLDEDSSQAKGFPEKEKNFNLASSQREETASGIAEEDNEILNSAAHILGAKLIK
ncbi:MAG: DNA polymerase III subunit gamma/tau [Candidatus Caenarcaniphilales bacterium]|nr:DNA polymerase III subunit gamma/tau [Candidatus Caenarcaniphilales bacterium]